MGRLFGADRVEQPVALDTPVPTAVGITLSALATFQSFTDPAEGQGFSDRPIPRVPSIVIGRIVLKSPTRQRCSVFEAIAARAGEVVVMSDAASERLIDAMGSLSRLPGRPPCPTHAKVLAAV